MTDTTDATPIPEPAPAPPPRARRWKLIGGLAAGVAVLAVGITALAVTRDDDNDQPATRQIAAARQACQQWLDNGTASQGAGPGAGWCDDMATRMTDDMANSQMMMGPMMWDDPQAMRDWCIQTMGTSQTANGDPAQWCDQMVGWMSQHMGDWDNWHDYWDD